MSEPQQDHKEIGKNLDLFHLEGENPGVIFWHPKGATLYNLIADDLKKELTKQGYQFLKTPNVLAIETFKKSGHYDNYQDKMYFAGNKSQIEKKEPKWVVTPMNCPGTLEVYKSKMHSYKELPIKFAEMGSVYRYEQPGEVNGLFRAREFTVDDAHIFALIEQVSDEVSLLIDFIIKYYKKYDFEIDHIELSTRPEKSIGTDEDWKITENALENALEKSKIKYKLNPGDGAFYGPKVDFHIKDNHGRTWQLGTIQVDMSMPERLGCFYIDEKGGKKYPVMIHRAILGSLERFIGILLEHFSGALPVWLAQTQVIILPITDKHIDYACGVSQELKETRVEVDKRSESV
ncbi:MAG: thrS, partial [Candidatus Berkelbacteria bacterium]|nr:thrS [Candidatus Berkelbacteria bacterium]